MVDTIIIPKSNRFPDIEQVPDSSPVKPRPRHPYAFCQCAGEGEDCVDCLKEQVQALEDKLQEKNNALEIMRTIATEALSRNSITREDIETLVRLYQPHFSN